MHLYNRTCKECVLTSAGDSIEPSRWRTNQRREYVMRTLGRRRSMADRGFYRKYKRRDEKGEDQSGAEDGERAEAPDHPHSKVGSAKRRSPTVKPSTDQPPSYEQVPNMSPMPLPIIEEALSDNNSSRGKNPIILGMSSETTKGFRPSAPSPLLDVRSLSTSPLSAVSSLHGK